MARSQEAGVKPESTAEWRLNPVTERDLLEGRRLARRRRANRWLLGLALAGGCPFACLGPCFSVGGPGGSWAFGMAIGSIGLLIVAAMRVAADKETTRRRLDALRSEFGDVVGWLVEVTVGQGDALSGRDVGIVWFEQGRLYFTGARTSFGLGVDDAQDRIAGGSWAPDGSPHLVLPLRAQTQAGPVSVGFRFLQGELDAASLQSSHGEFRKEIQRWLRTGDMARGQLPPLTLGPDLPSVWSLERRALAATAVWPALVLLIGLLLSMGGVYFLVGLGISIPLLCLWPSLMAPRRLWRAVRDRKALERRDAP